MRNKIIVITGAGSGIGRALAVEYGKLGAKLALSDFNKQSLDETVGLLHKQGIQEIITAVFDVSEQAAMRRFAGRVKASWGNAHTLINNAGIAGSSLPAYLTKEEDYRRVMNVNFFGVVNGCQAFLPQLVDNNEGAIINISSIFGLAAAPNASDYCASKFAVRGYTEALAVEFMDSPIGIHCVHPGGINTNIAADNQAFHERFLKTPPQKLAQHIVRAVRRKKVKIIFGHNSKRVWFLSNFIPQKWANFLVWNNAKAVLDKSEYESFIKGKSSSNGTL